MTRPYGFCAAVAALLAAALAIPAGPVFAGGPAVVTSGNADPACFAPWSESTRLFRFEARKSPYRVALVNGYVGNSWRIQMIRTAKAYAAKPDVAAKLREFKVVSTGEDVAAQVAAVNRFIDAGYDAILVDAQDPSAFGPAIDRARKAGVVLVAFDNTLDSEDVINVNVDQKGLGRFWARWLVQNLPRGGKLLEVRGLPGTAVDRDRHDGVRETLATSGGSWGTVEVVGRWDDATARRVVADAIAAHGRFDAVVSQAGDDGVVRAMIDAGHPFVPYGGENENGFRKACAQFGAAGLRCASGGTGPAQVAVALRTALAALEGKVVPQSIKLPLATVTYPDFVDGRDFHSELSGDFFVGNDFPTCGIALTPREILDHDHADQ